MTYFSNKKLRTFGHRGAAGLAPENTLPSFALAAALGVEYLELDVHATRDGVIVVFHDPTLERTTDGLGEISSFTFGQLQKLDAGYQHTTDGRFFPYRGQGVRILALETLLRAFPQLCFNIEIKAGDRATIEAVVALLDRAGASDRTLLAAEHDSIMQEIRSVVGDRIATSASAAEMVTFIQHFQSEDWSGYDSPARALQIPPSFGEIQLVTTGTVAAAHRLGKEVHVWTINDAAEIDRLIGLGVDGIMSDLPGLLTAALERCAA